MRSVSRKAAKRAKKNVTLNCQNTISHCFLMNRQTFFYGFHSYLFFVHIILIILSLRLCVFARKCFLLLHLPSMALLVFQSAPAGTGVVASDLCACVHRLGGPGHGSSRAHKGKDRLLFLLFPFDLPPLPLRRLDPDAGPH